SLAPPRAYGRAFGLERAGDNLGAVVGPLVAAGLVAWLGIRPAIWFALIPGVLAAIAIGAAAREARRHGDGVRERIRFNLAGLRTAGLARPLLPVVLFECGNLATTLLILRATQLFEVQGMATAAAASTAILIYAAHNAVAAGVSVLGGRWIDRTGPRRVFAAGALVYVLGYAVFAFGPTPWWAILVAFALAGAGIGFAETAESTLVAQILPDNLRGSGFGVIGGVQAFGNIVGTVVAGILYTTVSPTAGFLYAAAWMLLSFVGSIAFRTPGAGGRERA
ncbi:MAG: MFS transporter, partial [Leifsonia sp.]